MKRGLWALAALAVYTAIILTLWPPAQKVQAQTNPSTFFSEGAYAQNMEFLGSASCTAASCASIGPITVPTRDILMIVVKITGYGGSDIVSARFNGDSGANYWDRHLTSVAGGVVFVNTQTASTTLCRLAGVAQSGGRIITMIGINKATLSKHFTIDTGDITGAAATVGRWDRGDCEWVNTTAQITDITMLAAGGQTLTQDTEFGVFGKNF